MTDEKNEGAEIEYIVTKREDGNSYSLDVSCTEGLTEAEFADALIAFAEDIQNGTFSFDGESHGDIVSTQ